MIYGPGETPIQPAPGDNRVRIYRHPEEVFSPKTIASYAGKALVDDHPDDDVTPINWRTLAMGIILNPRQGVGDQADLIVGDVMVTDPDVIKLIEDNEKVELSAGYDADYEQTAPGEGVQKNIIVNHVALVDSGRCGPRCKIGDHATKPKEKKRMATMDSVRALLQKAFKAKDAAELEPLEKEAEGMLVGGEGGEGGDHHVHVHLPAAGGGSESANKDDLEPAGGGEEPDRMDEVEDLLDALCEKLGVGDTAARDKRRALRDKRYKDRTGKDRVRTTPDAEGETAEEKRAREEKEAKDKAMKDDETIEGALEMEAPPGTGDMARKAKDSAYLGDAFQLLLSQIEIISPGARAPTYDSAARPAVTYSKMCGMRTETLSRAYSTNDALKTFMDSMNGGQTPNFTKMTCDSARMMIAAVATEASRLHNSGGNNEVVPGFGAYTAKQGSAGGLGVKGKIMTPADLNRMAAERYRGKAA